MYLYCVFFACPFAAILVLYAINDLRRFDKADLIFVSIMAFGILFSILYLIKEYPMIS